MSGYTSYANVILNLNGQQSQKVLAGLEKQARSLERQLAKAAAAGNKASMKKIQRELTSVNKLIQQLKGSAASTEQVLARLGKASPKELNKALRTLQLQLNGIQRGTAAWDAQVAKIRAVKAEIAKLNASLVAQKSIWARMNSWLNNCQTALLGIGAAVTGLIMAGRKSVNAFADMEEAFANTIKYTRMSREEVAKLQEAFGRMDTRTPREKLNALAQEAGRLGMNTIEAVQGYVEAADIINVALVDLGEGATQTIAKLTNIFGVQQMLGVKESMLAVGSTVNHLSQNCTASKPYLVEFAQRMAGIGATAGLTIPEILAFGAVLDANGQKVEMSATAIQKVLMNLANKNKAFAHTLGMDADLLNQTLKRSAVDGLLLFLDRLHEIGETTDYNNATMTLAPAFKDMGLDAARVSQVLSTLAKHVDEVKWQLGEASSAFREASSATNEFNIFNNTAQASIDKAKNRVHELAVQLGEKLFPVMRHIYTSSGVFLRVLNTLVSFLISHRTAIMQLCAVIATYTIAVNASTMAVKLHHSWTVLTEKATVLLKGAILLARMAFYGLTGQISKCSAAFRLLNSSMKASPWSVVAAAVVALGVAIYNLVTRTTAAQKATAEFGKRLKEAENKALGFNEEMQREQHELAVLFGSLEGATKGTADYNAVKDKIIKQYGQYLSGLIDEKGEIINLTAAYQRLAKAIRRTAEEKGIANAKEEVNNSYYSELNSLLESLQDSLEQHGADTNTAAELVKAVGTSIAADKAIPDDIVSRLNSFSANIPSNMGYQATMHYRANNTSGFVGWLNQRIADLFTFGGGEDEVPENPADLVNAMLSRRKQRDQSLANIDNMHDAVNPMRKVNETELNWAINSLQLVVDSGKDGSAMIHEAGNVFKYVNVTLDEAKQLLAEYKDEAAIRQGSIRNDQRSGSPDLDTDIAPLSNSPDLGLNLSESPEEKKERLESERQAKKALKDDLKEQQRLRDEALAENQRRRSQDIIDETEFLKEKDRIQLDFIAASKNVLEQKGLQDTAEYAALVKKEEDITAAALERMKKRELKELDTQYTNDSTANSNEYHNGQKDYAAYLDEKERLDINYVNARLEVYRAYNATETDEYAKLLADQERMLEAHLERQRVLRRDDIDREHSEKLGRIELDYYTPGSDSFLDSSKHEQQVFDELVRYLKAKRDTYLEGSQEWQRLDNQIADATALRAQDRQKEYADAYKSLMAEEVRKSEYAHHLSLIDNVYAHELQLAEGNEKRKMALSKAYHLARVALAKQYGVAEGNAMKKAVEKTAVWLESEGGQALQQSLSTLSSGLSDIFSGVTSLMQAELEIQTAEINKRYDAELELADGNSYRVAQLEKRKQKELAKVKTDAEKKMYTMQVIQAVAQTAQNAIAAYGSAAAIPVIGFVMAPIAAAMAVAAGMIQIAAIKKQQQASLAQGYSEGGFTPDGRVDEPVGIVHAGEWVASRKLVRNPKTRPLLEALEKAQRNNTIGGISAANVSAALTAPMVLAARQPAISVSDSISGESTQEMPKSFDFSALSESLEKLNRRLDHPMVGVVSVTGEAGIISAEDEYERLLRNKSPKLRKSKS